ncbi:hypothetical protein SAMN04487950_3100 [Halogranum rubrum]|uniref:Uncharacterized protein n=1 Tax=Halogranum rubrum TaxID=553466 RepID=A0A1I4G832_9EURY|nr:hypothetical protein [Halogranum rubrum]SFL26134.1 hypothetical protein SAMN04487950_3100 [Halogranum rubrum]
MNAKYGLGVLGWLLVVVLVALFVVDDAFTWLEQGALPGVEFLILGVVALVAVVVGLRSMRAHRPPPGH